MSSPVCPRLAFVLLLALWSWSCSTTALPFNMSVEASGDDPELIFPTSRATHVPPPTPTLPAITTTFIRLKDFLFNQVVDFLRDNMLLIIVVMSLLIVIIFIACCASAMSHKRKLEAYYPPRKHAPRKYMTVPGKGAEQSQMEPKPHTDYLRAPSKALVGEKEGKDPRPKPKEVQKAEDVEEVEVQKEEEKKKKTEESKPSTSTVGNGQVPVCTCHLRKANQASH